MTDALTFSGDPHPRTIWVFALDIDPVTLPAWESEGAAADWPLPATLGVPSLDPAHVEVFPDERISEYGLDTYLTEASGMNPDEVTRDATKLEALSGVVALVHSRALAEPGRFSPTPPARFIGRYSEKTTLTASVPFTGGATSRGSIGTGPAPKPMTFPWRIISVTSLAIALLGLLLWWLL